uniref:GPN-loop GTPase n=1 Tax=Syphacia muris TaxID=451379 RepID=A0A0N5B1A3_9BILA
MQRTGESSQTDESVVDALSFDLQKFMVSNYGMQSRVFLASSLEFCNLQTIDNILGFVTPEQSRQYQEQREKALEQRKTMRRQGTMPKVSSNRTKYAAWKCRHNTNYIMQNFAKCAS